MRKLLLLGTIVGGIILAAGCSAGDVDKDGMGTTTEAGIIDGVSDITNEMDELNQPGGESENQQIDDVDFKIDAGQYTGQIDSNSIEVRIVGIQPEEEAFKAFRLSEEIKENFDSYSLNENDFIILKYKIDNNGVGVIYDIQRNNQSTQNEANGNFFVKGKNGVVYLGEWDNKIDLEKVLGNKLSERIDKLDEGADTFAGSYVKNIEFEGVKVTLVSPSNNDQTFWVQNMLITSKDYEVLKGIKVGDSLEHVKGELKNNLAEVNIKDGNQIYSYSVELDMILFHFKANTLDKIEVKKEMP